MVLQCKLFRWCAMACEHEFATYRRLQRRRGCCCCLVEPTAAGTRAGRQPCPLPPRQRYALSCSSSVPACCSCWAGNAQCIGWTSASLCSMVAFSLFIDLVAKKRCAVMLQGMRRAQQLAPWPAGPGAALAAHAGRTAAALQQQLGMASEFATVQACHTQSTLPLTSTFVTEPHSDACQQQQSALLSPAQQCCHAQMLCTLADCLGYFAQIPMRISYHCLGRPLRTRAWRQQPRGCWRRLRRLGRACGSGAPNGQWAP